MNFFQWLFKHHYDGSSHMDAIIELRKEKRKREKEMLNAIKRRKVAELASEMDWWEHCPPNTKAEYHDYKYRSP